MIYSELHVIQLAICFGDDSTRNLKRETALFEQEVFPQFVFLIKEFLEAANETIREEYVEQWNSELIQENANYILKQISCLENNN